MSRTSILALVLTGALLASPALAQVPAAQPGAATVPAGSVGATNDGSAPARAASTSAVGRTKPPGAAADGVRPDLEEKTRRLSRRINTGICAGCK
jgi:hypothetical protein